LHAIGDLARLYTSRVHASRLSRIAVQLLNTSVFRPVLPKVKAPFAKGSWSDPVEQAAKPLRGWLGLREKLIHSQDQSVRYTAGNETFLFRF
jgi:hypothetical protein